MLVSKASFRETLEEGDAPTSLYLALEEKWKVSSNLPNNSSKSRAGFDIEVGSLLDTGTVILSFLASLVSRQSAGLNILVLCVVSAAGGVDIVHSLFLVNGSEYEEALPEVWGIIGEIPKEGSPTFTKLSSMIFSTNTTFTATSFSEFEAHVASL